MVRDERLARRQALRREIHRQRHRIDSPASRRRLDAIAPCADKRGTRHLRAHLGRLSAHARRHRPASRSTACGRRPAASIRRPRRGRPRGRRDARGSARRRRRVAACSVAVRAKASSVAASLTTRFWIADSSPPEKAKPPIGNIESPNCSSRAKSGCGSMVRGSLSEFMKLVVVRMRR